MTATLYRAYDDAGQLLYVGMSISPLARLEQHANGPWMAHVANVTFERYPDRETAAAAERSAIRCEDPVFNRAGRPIERAMQWWVAYQLGKHADDVTPQDVARCRRDLDALCAAALKSLRPARAAILDGGHG